MCACPNQTWASTTRVDPEHDVDQGAGDRGGNHRDQDEEHAHQGGAPAEPFGESPAHSCEYALVAGAEQAGFLTFIVVLLGLWPLIAREVTEDVLREGLRHRLLEFLCNEAGFDPELAQRMHKWQHSGFSVHNQIRVKANDAEGRKQLARYMIRNPFALEKMTYDGKTGMVIYRSKFHSSLKRNYQLLDSVS